MLDDAVATGKQDQLSKDLVLVQDENIRVFQRRNTNVIAIKN